MCGDLENGSNYVWSAYMLPQMRLSDLYVYTHGARLIKMEIEVQLHTFMVQLQKLNLPANVALKLKQTIKKYSNYTYLNFIEVRAQVTFCGYRVQPQRLTVNNA